ncbi:hypothetical protein K439DRAFT_80946 [Ramaria rubella]|nr:hypothetical protein K439DRAFT_80946 [Ramaria rubella]
MREGAEADGADIHAVPLKTDFEREPHCLDGQEILHAAASEHLDSSQNILTHATPAAAVAPPEVAVDHTDAAIWAESQNEQLLAEQKDVALTQIEVSKETIHTSVGEGIRGVSAEVDIHLPGNPQRFPAESQIFTDVSLHDAAVERDDAVKWEAPMDIKPEKQGPAPPENIKRGWNFLADSHEFEKLSTTAPVPSLASVSAEQQETEWTLLKSPLHEAEKSHGDDVQPHSDTEGSTERRILTSSNSSSSSSSGVMVQRVEEDGTGGALANFTNCDSSLQQPIDTQRFTEQISSEALVQGIMERDTGDVQATVCGDAAQSGHCMQDSAEQPNLSRESSSSIVFDEVVEGDMEIISLKSRGPGDLCDGDRVPLGKQSVEQTNQSVVEPSSEQIIHPSISEERGANFVKYEESSHASSGAESERGSQSRNDSDNRVKRDAQTLSVNASMTGRLDSSFPGSLPADAESFTRNYGARTGDKLVSSIGDGARFSTEQKDLNLTGWSSNTMARASVEESRDFGGLNVQQTTDHTTNVPAFPYEGVADRRERSVSQSRFIQKSRGAVAGSAFFCPHCSPHPCKFLTDLSREEQELSVLESQPNTQCGTSANYQQLGNATSVREHETLKTLSNHSDDATNSVPMVDHQLPAEGSIIFAGRARTPPNLAVLTAGETSGKEAEHRSVEEESHSATNPIDSLASINLHLPINTSVEDGDGSLLPSHLTAGQNSLTSTASSSSEFALYKPEGGQQSHLSGIVEKSTVIESLQEQIQEDLLVQGIDGDPRYAERNIPFIERPALNADTISNDFLEPRDRATPKSDSSSIPGNTASGRDIDQPVEKPQTSTPHSVLAATMPSTGEFAVQGTSVSVPHAMEQVSNSNEEVTKEASIELQIEEAVTSSVHSVTHVDDSNETHVVNRAHHSEAYVANEIDETDPVSPCHHAPAIDEVRPESATGAAHEGPLVSVDSEICASDNIHEQADVHVDVIHKRVTTDDEGEGVLSHGVHEEDTIASPAAYDMDHEEDGVDSDRPLEDTPAEIHKGAVIDEVLEQNAPEQDQVPAVLAHEEVAVNELHEIVAIEKVEELTGDQVSPEASLDKPLENNPISEVPEEFTSGAGEDSEVPPAVDVCEDASVNKVCQEHAIDGIEESREGAITDLVQSPAILAHREARVIGNEAHDEAESHEEPIGDQVSQTIPRCKATNNPAVNSEGPEEPASCRDDEAPPAIDDTSRSVTGTNEVHEEPALDEAHQELGQDGAAVRQEIDTGTICDNVTHFNADEDVFEEHTEVMHLELHDNVL